MGLSIFLAQWLGIYMLVAAAAWIFRRELIENALKEVIPFKSFIVLSGFVQILVGLAIAIGHPIWQWSWIGLITLLGWISLIRGLAHLWFMEEMQRYMFHVIGKGYWIMIVLLVVIGAFLTYHGFVG